MIGKPKFKRGNVVTFTLGEEEITGIVVVVDKWGIFCDHSDVFYDIFDETGNKLYKHVKEKMCKEGGNEMNFNTQIGTSIEQSRQLLALGIKKETADMVWIAEMGYDAKNFRSYDTGNYFLCPIDDLEGEEHRDNVPAWSLHRLIAMCPDFVIADQRNHERLYEQVIANIKFAIEEGSFDVKYLEE